MRKSFNIQIFNDFIKNNNIKYLKESFNIFLKKIYIFSFNRNKKYNKNYFSDQTEDNKHIINPYQELGLENYENRPFELILKLNETLSEEKNESLNIIFKNKLNNDKIIEIIFQNFSQAFENISIRYFMSQNILIFGIKLYFKFIPLEKTLLERITKIQKKKLCLLWKY